MSDQNAAFLIFGASGGIGSQVARLLRERGFGVALASREKVRVEELAAQIGGVAIEADPCEPDQAVRAVEEAVAGLGRIDGIVNCVGSILLKPAHRTTAAEFDEVIRTNLRSAFGTVHAGAGAMKKGGSIVLLSTAAARIGLANHEAIAAAKAGVVGLAQSAAASYAARGLRVNVVAPGLVETPLAAPVVASEASRKASEAMHPLGRLGKPEQVASAIAWFLDPAQEWVTGQVLGVDGGLGSVRSRA